MVTMMFRDVLHAGEQPGDELYFLLEFDNEDVLLVQVCLVVQLSECQVDLVA